MSSVQPGDASPANPPAAGSPAKWRPLAAIDRRVLGVLVEKAKTTPEQYPLSSNALRAGCNQKSNRYPLLEVDENDIEQSLERLKAAGAVAEVQGGGRVARFRHYAYEWLGVDKVEAAVMTELLLRGTQTEGELRGRAARMEPIADLTALRPVLQSLKAKGLVIGLTAEGRGHVVTHALWQPQEMEKQRREVAAGHWATGSDESPAESAGSSSASLPPAATRGEPSALPSNGGDAAKELPLLRQEVQSLREQVAQLRKDVDDLWASLK